MATNFPTSLDTFTNPNSGNTLDSPSHSIQHSDINDAVEAIEAKVGVGSSTAGSATAGYALVNTSGGTTAYSLLGVTGLSSGTAVANTVLTANGSGATTFAPTAQGLTLLIPSSVAVGSGTGTVSATGTVTFSGASSVSVNDVFSTNYAHYLVFLEITAVATADADIYMKLRVSGSDASTSYNQVRTRASSSGGGTTALSVISNDTIGFYIGEWDSPTSGAYYNSQIDIVNPFETVITTQKFWFGSVDKATNTVSTNGAGHHSQAVSYTGFSILPTAGTMTGTVRVYGYNK